MVSAAVRLVEAVIPNVPVRQRVLSLPAPMRHLLAAHPQVSNPVLEVDRAVSGLGVAAALTIRPAISGIPMVRN